MYSLEMPYAFSGCGVERKQSVREQVITKAIAAEEV